MKKVFLSSLIVSTILFSVGCSTKSVDATTKTETTQEQGGDLLLVEGLNFIKQKRFLEAKPKLEEADKLGNSSATHALGLMYINGDGVTRDYKKAMQYFQKAYANGNKKSAYDIGAMYKNGEGVKRDIEKVKKYYLIAAKSDYGLAQFELAKIYAYERNEKEFMFWAKKAVKHGFVFKAGK